MSGNAVEITKLAVRYTDIGGIDVSVNLPGNLSMRYLLFSQFIGYLHQFSKGGLFKQELALFFAEEFQVQCALVQIG
jgi:hypothetical protein